MKDYKLRQQEESRTRYIASQKSVRVSRQLKVIAAIKRICYQIQLQVRYFFLVKRGLKQ